MENISELPAILLNNVESMNVNIYHNKKQKVQKVTEFSQITENDLSDDEESIERRNDRGQNMSHLMDFNESNSMDDNTDDQSFLENENQDILVSVVSDHINVQRNSIGDFTINKYNSNQTLTVDDVGLSRNSDYDIMLSARHQSSEMDHIASQNNLGANEAHSDYDENSGNFESEEAVIPSSETNFHIDINENTDSDPVVSVRFDSTDKNSEWKQHHVEDSEYKQALIPISLISNSEFLQKDNFEKFYHLYNARGQHLDSLNMEIYELKSKHAAETLLTKNEIKQLIAEKQQFEMTSNQQKILLQEYEKNNRSLKKDIENVTREVESEKRENKKLNLNMEMLESNIKSLECQVTDLTAADYYYKNKQTELNFRNKLQQLYTENDTHSKLKLKDSETKILYLENKLKTVNAENAEILKKNSKESDQFQLDLQSAELRIRHLLNQHDEDKTAIKTFQTDVKEFEQRLYDANAKLGISDNRKSISASVLNAVDRTENSENTGSIYNGESSLNLDSISKYKKLIKKINKDMKAKNEDILFNKNKLKSLNEKYHLIEMQLRTIAQDIKNTRDRHFDTESMNYLMNVIRNYTNSIERFHVSQQKSDKDMPINSNLNLAKQCFEKICECFQEFNHHISTKMNISAHDVRCLIKVKDEFHQHVLNWKNENLTTVPEKADQENLPEKSNTFSLNLKLEDFKDQICQLVTTVETLEQEKNMSLEKYDSMEKKFIDISNMNHDLNFKITQLSEKLSDVQSNELVLVKDRNKIEDKYQSILKEKRAIEDLYEKQLEINPITDNEDPQQVLNDKQKLEAKINELRTNLANRDSEYQLLLQEVNKNEKVNKSTITEDSFRDIVSLKNEIVKLKNVFVIERQKYRKEYLDLENESKNQLKNCKNYKKLFDSNRENIEAFEQYKKVVDISKQINQDSLSNAQTQISKLSEELQTLQTNSIETIAQLKCSLYDERKKTSISQEDNIKMRTSCEQMKTEKQQLMISYEEDFNKITDQLHHQENLNQELQSQSDKNKIEYVTILHKLTHDNDKYVKSMESLKQENTQKRNYYQKLYETMYDKYYKKQDDVNRFRASYEREITQLKLDRVEKPKVQLKNFQQWLHNTRECIDAQLRPAIERLSWLNKTSKQIDLASIIQDLKLVQRSVNHLSKEKKTEHLL